MKINILTLFPEMFDIFNHSIIGKAQDKGLIKIEAKNIRDYTLNKHKKVDDYPYGGGAGMVMAAQPVVDAIRASKEENLIFVCGHYEGIDERAFKEIDMQVSLGDFILTGGEMAAIPVIDSILRLVPGVLNKAESHEDESFSNGLLEYPQYTRPEVFEGESVPQVLLSGHHENIRKWRRLQSLIITKEKRPDLYKDIQLTKEDKKLLNLKK